MKANLLARRLAGLQPFVSPQAGSEQVSTPPEAAAHLLLTALGRGDLEGRSVADLGSGTGLLSIGAAWLGAGSVTGIDRDATAVAVARENARAAEVDCEFIVGEVDGLTDPVDTVVMNPPFGAQRRGADRKFWEVGLTIARQSVYAFSLRDSRSFIEGRVVARGARIEATQPVPWDLPRTFPHHRERHVALPVDLWVLRTQAAP